MKHPLRPLLLAAVFAALPAAAPAQTPSPPATRLPPAGVALAEADRRELIEGAAKLRKAIDATARELAVNPAMHALLPDVEVLHKAVDWALRYDEFFHDSQVIFARLILDAGQQRLRQLVEGRPRWLEGTGAVVRGYRSKLDGSVQPYAMVIPAGWRATETRSRRLDIVLSARHVQRTELGFMIERLPLISGRTPPPNEFVPADGIVLYPYGRFANATKFAGEADVFEALAAARTAYRVDPDRIIVRGHAMGGASTWHLATHHAGVWCAAAPSGGFAETARATQELAASREPAPWWEQKLWRWYDATAYAPNLFNCPTVAYQETARTEDLAVDLMAEAMAAEGLARERLTGPPTSGPVQASNPQLIAARLNQLALRGRTFPTEVHLTTYTLQYPRNSWVAVTGLGRHWERADVRARIDRPGVMTVTTKNVTGLQLSPGDDWTGTITIDGQRLTIRGDVQFGAISLARHGERWSVGTLVGARRKLAGLTGPVDDAFMDSFLFVRPTGKAAHAKVGDWAARELALATKLWRDVFRGDVPVKDDTAITAEDVATKHLVLWGDPASNEILAQILARLPLTWDAKQLGFRGQTYDATRHAPILIFPNPLNPSRYVVLNSGIDLRDDAYGPPALITPKLPDYAIVDLDTPPGPRWPGKIVAAGFFDESWQ